MRITGHNTLVAVLAGWLGLLAAPAAHSAVRFVDGRCPTSGTGAQLACGANGPFRTIGEGIMAMQPGDTLNVRAGVYVEQLTLSNDSTQRGKALACTASAPCVIQGCRAPACPTNETPVVRGMRLASDWVDAGGGVYRRVMETVPDIQSNDTSDHRTGDPRMLMQGTAHPFVMMPYAGDNVAAPADGRWSFHPATRTLVVNPLGTAHPATSVHVPHFNYVLRSDAPTAHVTIAHMALEGARLVGAQWTGSSSGTPGLQMRNVQVRYFPRFGIRTTLGAPGALLEDVVVENGCRGISWALSTGDGCFGLRLFGFHNGVIRRTIVRHLGATGRQRFSNLSASAWPCPWCDAPWNDPQHTLNSTSGVAVNVKQSEGTLIEDTRVEDISTRAYAIDVSRYVTVRRSSSYRSQVGFSQENHTPTTRFPYGYANVFQGNAVDTASRCGMSVSNSDNPTGTLLATVEGNTIAAAATPLCLPSPLPGDLIVRNNLIQSQSSPTTTQPSTTLVSTTSSTSSTVASSSSTTLPPTTTSTRPPTTTSTTRPPTTTTIPGATTTTTLPGFARPVDGMNLTLRDDPTDPARRTLYVRSEDAAALVPGDPTAFLSVVRNGAILRVRALGGDGFDGWYVLPPQGWRLIDPLDPTAGVSFRDPDGPITSMVFDTHDLLRVAASGAALVHSLTTEPDIVEVDLWFGRYRYCLEFGGSVQRFTSDLELVRRSAPGPIACADPFAEYP